LTDETISSSEKKPIIQVSSDVKFIAKKKSHTSVFVASSSIVVCSLTGNKDEKKLFVYSYLPKHPFENPSRAPPVV